MRFSQALFVLCFISVQPAQADLFEAFGSDARSQAMGSASVAVSQGHGSIYHNPAGLVFGGQRLSIGLFGNYDRTTVRLMRRPSGYDPTDYETRVHARADTQEYGSSGGLLLGGTIHPWQGKLALGAMVAMPFEGVARMDTVYHDEREQYFSNRLSFVRMGANARRESIGFGLAYKFKPWLAMGLGLMVLPEVKTVNRVYTPNAADPSTVYLNIDTKNSLREALVVGVMAKPHDSVTLGVALQDEIAFNLGGRNDVQVRGTNDDEVINQTLALTQGYHPPRATGGLGFEFSNDCVVDLEVSWMGWSRFRGSHDEQVAFNDVVEYRGGVELPFAKESSVRVGGGWKPSPVGVQDGRFNYVDNDRFVVAAGGGRQFELWGQRFQLDVAVQLHGLISKTVHKKIQGAYEDCAAGGVSLCDEFPDPGAGVTDELRARSEGLQTGNPGFPGYSHGGYLIHAALELQWLY